jgi:hypothetical protein
LFFFESQEIAVETQVLGEIEDGLDLLPETGTGSSTGSTVNTLPQNMTAKPDLQPCQPESSREDSNPPHSFTW